MQRVFLGLGALAGLSILAGCERTLVAVENVPADLVPPALAASSVPANGRLTLARFVQLVTYADESVRAQALEMDVTRQQVLVADGAFEPELYFQANRSYENRQTTAEQLSSAVGGPDPFWAQTRDGELGVKIKSHDGVNLDLYVEMTQVSNSLQASANLPLTEHITKAGVSIKIPVLRNAGYTVNTSNIKIAQIDQEIARHTVALVKSKRAYEGLRTYTAYQRAEARVDTRKEMLRLTQLLAREVERQLDNGLSNPADLTAARGRIAESRAALTQAKMELAEQRDGLQVFFNGLPSKPASQMWLPASRLSAVDGRDFKTNSLDQVYARRPEIKIQELQIERCEIERLVAENATKPEFNFILDFAKTRLSGDYVPFRDLFTSNNPYENWRAGFEYRRVLGGNQTARAEFKAAKLREEQAALTMNAFRQRLTGEVNAMRGILSRAQKSVHENTKVFTAQHRLVKDEHDKEHAGLSTRVDVISRQIEEVLAREARNDAIAQFNQAYYLSDYVNGTLLEVFGAS